MTLGRGQCRGHCIECYAVDGVCDKHRADPHEAGGGGGHGHSHGH